MRRGAMLFVLVAFVFSSGGSWTVLQCLAWANMIREYSQVVPLGEAVQMTLSGKYPCAMCKALADKQNSNDAKAFTLAKHDKPMLAQAVTLRPRVSASDLDFIVTSASPLDPRAEAPPVPPPRLG